MCDLADHRHDHYDLVHLLDRPQCVPDSTVPWLSAALPSVSAFGRGAARSRSQPNSRVAGAGRSVPSTGACGVPTRGATLRCEGLNAYAYGVYRPSGWAYIPYAVFW